MRKRVALFVRVENLKESVEAGSISLSLSLTLSLSVSHSLSSCLSLSHCPTFFLSLTQTSFSFCLLLNEYCVELHVFPPRCISSSGCPLFCMCTRVCVCACVRVRVWTVTSPAAASLIVLHLLLSGCNLLSHWSLSYSLATDVQSHWPRPHLSSLKRNFKQSGHSALNLTPLRKSL